MGIGVKKRVVYKRYIYRDGKKFGPYYYHTYRDKYGNTHSKYIEEPSKISAVTGHAHKKSIFKSHPLMFILSGAILIFILGIFYLNSYYSSQGGFEGQQGVSGFEKIFNNVKSFVTGYTSEGSPEPIIEIPSETPSETPSDSEGSSITPETPIDAVSTTESVPTTETPVTETPTTEAPTQEVTPSDSSISNETIVETPTNETTPQETTSNQTTSNETVANETITTTETPSGEIGGGIEGGAGVGGVISNETILSNQTVSEVNQTIPETNQTSNITISNETLNNITGILNITNITILEQNVTNITIINQTANFTTQETTFQYSAVLGQLVKWEKRVKVEVNGTDSVENFIIDLPELAGNVSVKKIKDEKEEDVESFVRNEKKINEKNSPITGSVTAETGENGFLSKVFNFILGFFRGGITGQVIEGDVVNNVEVEINSPVYDNEELVLQYYTDAPYSEEKEIKGGKQVKIIGPREVHYENVLVFTSLAEELNVKDSSKIKIYWEEQASYVLPSKVDDVDANGIYDYVEWVVPSLSNQTFNIIVITKAEHLDVNKSFISDIYNEVKNLDGVWSETINDGEYVRITFEHMLDSSRDITVYPRIVNGTPRIEVYENNGSEVIAEFSSLTENDLNKVYLTGLQGTQDTFDLKILDGSVEFDYIIDPTPTIVTYYPNQTNQIAYKGYDTSPPSPALSGWDSGPTALSSTDENNISLSDNIRAQVSLISGTFNRYNFHMAMFKISESASSINNITFTWEGYNEILGELSSNNDVHFYIYNFTTASWGTNRNTSCLDNACGSSANEKTLTYVLSSGISDYVNASGNVLLLVGERDDDALCPFVYSWNGTEYVFDNFVIKGLQGKEKEGLQLSPLENYKIINGNLDFQIREEIDETSYLDLAYLVVNDTKDDGWITYNLYPKYIIKNSTQQDLSLTFASDDNYLVITYGDVLDLRFEGIPDLVDGYNRSLFMAVEGYWDYNNPENELKDMKLVASKKKTHNTLYTDLMKIDVNYNVSDNPPQWSSNSTNSTGHGLAVKHNVYWTDDSALSGYIFSFANGTADFTNDSFVSMIGTTNWSNVTKGVNTTIGSTIQWKVYANDSLNQWNVTSAFSYLTTDNPPVVNLLSPENNSIISNPYINQTFSSNVTDDLNITSVEWWADFRGSGWQLEQTNSTTGLTNAIYNFTFNFSTWFASRDYLISSNLSNQNGRAISGNSSHFFTTSFQDDKIVWFDRTTNQNVSTFALPTTWVSGMDTNITHTYMLDKANANPIRQTYDNGTVITSCVIHGAGAGILNGLAFDNDSTTLWVVDDTADALRHYNSDCLNIENLSIGAGGYSSLTIDKNNYAYIRDINPAPDGIKVIYLEDGTNSYNISDIDGLVGDDAGGARGTWIDKTDTYPEKLYSSSSSSSNRLTYAQRRFTGSMIWNVNASDNNSQSSWGNSNWTVIFDTPPSVTLTSPENGTVVSSVSAVLNCSVEDYYDLVNVSLYGNWGDGWHLNQTIEITGNGNTSYDASFTISGLTELQDYLWNCLAYDNRSQSEWGNSNYTFTYGDCGTTQVSSSTTLTGNQCEHYNITANNVVFDCNNFKIYGNNSYGLWGVDALNRDNVTIKNCRLEQYAKAIRFFSTNNSVVQNSTLYNISWTNTSSHVSAYGISLENTYNSTIKDSNLSYFWTNTTSPLTCITPADAYLYTIYLNNSYNDMINKTIINNVNGQYYGDTDSEIGGCQEGYIDIGQGIVSPIGSYNVTEFKILGSNISNIYTTAVDLEHFVNLSINNSKIYSVTSILIRLGDSECCSDSATFFNNQFNSSGSLGVKMGGTSSSFISGKIVVDRNIFSDIVSDALEILDILPAWVEITNNNFYNASGNYMEFRFKNGTISNNVIDDSRGGLADYGFHISNNVNITMDNNTILNMTGSSAVGVYLLTNPDNLNITRLNITNCRTGLSLAGADNVSITNSTITNCNVSDVAITSSYNVQFYNVSFNKSRAHFFTAPTFFENYYQFRAKVIDNAQNPIDSASVDVRDKYGLSIISNDLTSASGFSSFNWIMEYNQSGNATYATGCTGSGSNINCSTPHNVTAYKTGYSTNSTNFTINISQIGELIIATPYIITYTPTTDTFSIAEPDNQTFNIAYINTSAASVRWYVNGSQQTSYANLSTYIWVGNYTQQGTYAILVNVTDANGWDSQLWTMTVNDTNAAPTHDNPSISPFPPSASQNFTCYNQSTADIDGNAVTNIYNWYVNSTSLTVLNMPFDTNSLTTARDYSGYGNNASISSLGGGTPSWIYNGKIGGAYNFSYTGNISIPKSSSLNNTYNFSIDFWIYPKDNSSSTINYIFTSTSDTTLNGEDGIITLRTSVDDLSIILNNVSSALSNNFFVTVQNITNKNEWQHITIVQSYLSDVTVYKNGIFFNSTINTVIGPFLTSNNQFHIGKAYDSVLEDYRYLNASLDNFRIWNRSLSAQQIYQLYADSLNGFTNNMSILAPETEANQNWTCEITPNDATSDGIAKQNSTVTSVVSLAMELSPTLVQQIYWNLSSFPAVNQSAVGNNETQESSNITQYWVNVSVSGATGDVYVKANDNLRTSGGDILVLANETFSNSTTNASVPASLKTPLSTSYQIIGSNLNDGNLIYLKFFLSAPASQLAGTYNNTLTFTIVENGQTP